MKAKKKWKRQEDLSGKIKYFIKSKTKNSGDYDEHYIKIKCNSYDKLLLNKAVEVPITTIVVRAVFLEKSKYYPHIFLDECLCKI